MGLRRQTWDAELPHGSICFGTKLRKTKENKSGKAIAQDIASRCSSAGFTTTSGTVRSKIQIRTNANMETPTEWFRVTAY